MNNSDTTDKVLRDARALLDKCKRQKIARAVKNACRITKERAGASLSINSKKQNYARY